MKLYKWQEDALMNWKLHNCKGIIEAGTGVGKTQIGLEAIKGLKVPTLIITPTIELMQQWKENLIKEGCPKNLIGELGNGKKELQKYTIGTFNSVRELLPEFDFIIVDEIHHLPSNKNSRILDIPCKFFLGMTATLQRNDMGHLRIIHKYPVVYSYSQEDGIRDGILADYTITPIYINLTPEERCEYEKYESIIKEYFPRFDFDLKKVISIATNGLHPNFDTASALMDAINKRKQILLNSSERIIKTAELINKYCQYEKIIVFSESIECAEKIFALVDSANKFIYHSGLKKNERKQIYEKFKNCKAGVVISCKALEEGVDFPSCKMGIISGGSSQSRQAIQRIGRFLRKYGDMEAKIFDVIVVGTKDMEWFKRRYLNWK